MKTYTIMEQHEGYTSETTKYIPIWKRFIARVFNIPMRPRYIHQILIKTRNPLIRKDLIKIRGTHYIVIINRGEGHFVIENVTPSINFRQPQILDEEVARLGSVI